MARILIVSHYVVLLNFRGELIKSMVGLGHEVFAAAPERVLRDWKRWGVLPAVSAAQTGLNPLQDLGSLLALIRMMRKIKPDVVLSYAIKPVIWLAGSPSSGVKRVFSMITGLGFVFVNGGAKRKCSAGCRADVRAAFKGNRAVFSELLMMNGCLRR